MTLVLRTVNKKTHKAIQKLYTHTP